MRYFFGPMLLNRFPTTYSISYICLHFHMLFPISTYFSIEHYMHPIPNKHVHVCFPDSLTTDRFFLILAFLHYYELAIALNILPIEQKTALDDRKQLPSIDTKGKLSTDGGKGGASGTTTVDNIEMQTSRNIQAAGKLTTTSNPKMRKEKSDPYECPNTSEFSFFPQYCSRHANCLSIGKEFRCCRQFNSKRCVKGVPKPLKEQRHERNYPLCIFIIFLRKSESVVVFWNCSSRDRSDSICLSCTMNSV